MPDDSTTKRLLAARGNSRTTRGRSQSVAADMGSVHGGQKTHLWSGGTATGDKYESLEKRAGADAMMRGRRTLEMTFGDQRGFENKDLGPIRGEVRQKLRKWDQNDPSTQAAWLEKSTEIARNARGRVTTTLHPNRMQGLLNPDARDVSASSSSMVGGASPVDSAGRDRIQNQQDRVGFFWQREQPEVMKNRNVHSLELKDAESGKTVTIPRGGRKSWEAPF